MRLKKLNHSPWKTLSKKIRYENPWITVTEHQVINPGKKRGIYGVVHFKNWAIGVVPIDTNGDTYLVGQYRYALGEYSWEIPEGGGAIGVSPLATAKRELLEETGIKARRYQEIMRMHLSNSVSDELAIIYIAFHLTQGAPEPEDDELLEVRRLPLESAYRMAIRGEITDSMSVAGLMRAHELIREKKVRLRR